MAKHGDFKMSPETWDRMHVGTILSHSDPLALGVEERKTLCALFESAIGAIEQTVFDAAFRIHGNYAAVHACGCFARGLLATKIYAIAAAEIFV